MARYALQFFKAVTIGSTWQAQKKRTRERYARSVRQGSNIITAVLSEYPKRKVDAVIQEEKGNSCGRRRTTRGSARQDRMRLGHAVTFWQPALKEKTTMSVKRRNQMVAMLSIINETVARLAQSNVRVWARVGQKSTRHPAQNNREKTTQQYKGRLWSRH